MNYPTVPLPHQTDSLFLTDGGLETWLVFQKGVHLPHFAAFDLLNSERGRDMMAHYFRKYLAIAEAHETGFVLESATWRAHSDWGDIMGYTAADLAGINQQAIKFLRDLRESFHPAVSPMIISGCLGPRGDGYRADDKMTVQEAVTYHSAQIAAFADAGADMVTALTLTYPAEARAITLAAEKHDLPAVISFTVETDGYLPDGTHLRDAIEQLDAAPDCRPAYYMINCAHPDHFLPTLVDGGDWVLRIRGIRANASCKSHEELDNSETLDEGDPIDLGARFRELRAALPHINVLGGCCGTDHRHIAAISAGCTAA